MFLKDIFAQAVIDYKDPIDRRKSIFYFVRNIPYSTLDFGLTAEEVVSKNKGNCQTKSLLLESLLHLEGYETRRLVYKYRLNDLVSEVKYIPEQSDFHHTLEVKINNIWVLVDSTYDKALEPLGFIVNEWDGMKSTKYSEIPIGQINYSDSLNKKLDLEFKEFNQRVEVACNKYSTELEKYSNDLEALFIKARL